MQDLSRPWEDPLAEAGDRHLAQELRGTGLQVSACPELCLYTPTCSRCCLLASIDRPPEWSHTSRDFLGMSTEPLCHSILVSQQLVCQCVSLKPSLWQGMEVPEWKAKALGKAPTYGRKDARPIKEQREGLPVFEYRQAIIDAVSSNQVCQHMGSKLSKVVILPTCLQDAPQPPPANVGDWQAITSKQVGQAASQWGWRIAWNQ